MRCYPNLGLYPLYLSFYSLISTTALFYYYDSSMPPAKPLDWVDMLSQAQADPWGGDRSFPCSMDAEISQTLGYHASLPEYQALFSSQAEVPGSPPDAVSGEPSAGWVISGETSDCPPLFVAHSTLSAIWLLWKTLPTNTLASRDWSRLTTAALQLVRGTSDEEELVPPSAQLETPRRGRKRPASPGLVRELVDTEATTVHTITNHNRQAEQTRARQRGAQQVRQKQHLGLATPGAHASQREKSAYESISQQDAPEVAWIIRQDTGKGADLYSTAAHPYLTATSMLERARGLGSPPAQRYTAAFLQTWRRRGSPFPIATQATTPSSSATLLATQVALQPRNSTRALASGIDDAFLHAYQLVDHYEQRLAAVHIEYRWAMALLGRAYAGKITELQQVDQLQQRSLPQSRGGKGHLRTEAIGALLRLLYPGHSPITGSARSAFKHRLHRATRWYEAASTLGWGCLCLMPYEFSHFWVEKTLRIGEWRIWLELAKKVNPDVCAASRAFEDWLGVEGITGGPISGKDILSIEAAAPRALCAIEEVEDSEEGEVDEVDRVDELSSSQLDGSPDEYTATLSTLPTLLQLFRPVE